MTAGPSEGREERRHAQRFLVSLPVLLEGGELRSRDVSESGVYFETAQPFSLGHGIKLSLVLEHVDPKGGLVVTCEGEIVRLDPLDGRIGVAVRFNSYELKQREGEMVAR